MEEEVPVVPKTEFVLGNATDKDSKDNKYKDNNKDNKGEKEQRKFVRTGLTHTRTHVVSVSHHLTDTIFTCTFAETSQELFDFFHEISEPHPLVEQLVLLIKNVLSQTGSPNAGALGLRIEELFGRVTTLEKDVSLSLTHVKNLEVTFQRNIAQVCIVSKCCVYFALSVCCCYL